MSVVVPTVVLVVLFLVVFERSLESLFTALQVFSHVGTEFTARLSYFHDDKPQFMLLITRVLCEGCMPSINLHSHYH